MLRIEVKRTDVMAVYSTTDATILPYLSECFPTAVGKSMLCERPCITSNVGYCSLILGREDWSFDVSFTDGFVSKLSDFANMSKVERQILGKECRARIVENFDISKYTNYAPKHR